MSNKKIFFGICFILLFTNKIMLFAESLDLWNNDISVEQFNQLTIEDRFNSYIDSFKDKIDLTPRSWKWAKRIAQKDGRDIIPLVNDLLFTATFDNNYRQPYDNSLVLVHYILTAAKNENLLSDNELYIYDLIFMDKIDLYVAKKGIIDGTVRVGLNCVTLSNKVTVPYDNTEELSVYYQQRLDQDYIIPGNFNSYWED